jgi:hypothetical protein
MSSVCQGELARLILGEHHPLTKEIIMSDQPNQDLPQEQGAKGRDNAAAKKAEADARKAAREADKAPHPDQTLP